MNKIALSAVLGLAFCLPVAAFGQDCGCCDPAPNPCVKTRKRLAFTSFTKEVCRLQMQCVTDECGCTTRKLVRVKKCVERKRLALVDVPVDPCKPRCFDRLRGRFANSNCHCPCHAPAEPTCGCEPSPAPCGCGG